ncbi:type IV pilin protein [Paraferrimonas sp. SM1919]|uniref:type IV pilin protein n=1 Tax=Paraferrimonas sp. SM1919 TaxID=2662263 RepID=UPI001F0967BC|nr:type IV pilin protein [Paraferrimonas sp. SM1919]
MKPTGFSLIELLVALAITAIIASVAYPSYTSYVIASARSEGLTTILQVAIEQDQYYLDFRRYSSNMQDLGFDSDPLITDNGHYQVDATVTSSNYIITASAQGVQSQRDGECSQITLSSEGEKLPESCW